MDKKNMKKAFVHGVSGFFASSFSTIMFYPLAKI